MNSGEKTNMIETINKVKNVEVFLDELLHILVDHNKDAVSNLLQATVNVDIHTGCRINLSTSYTFENKDGKEYELLISIGEPK